MSRQEDFIDAGIAYRMKHSKPMCIACSNLADVERDLNRVFPFDAGAKYGYQYAIDKACEVVEKLYPQAAAYYEQPETFVEQIRRAMEE